MTGPVRFAVAWCGIVALSLLWGSSLAPRSVLDCACGHEVRCLCAHENEAPACHRAMGVAAAPGSCSLTAPRPSADYELTLLPSMLPVPLAGADAAPARISTVEPTLQAVAAPVSYGGRGPEPPPPRLLG